MYFCLHSHAKKETKEAKEPKERNKKAKKQQDSKFPATDGVSLEYFLSELSDEDNSSW